MFVLVVVVRSTWLKAEFLQTGLHVIRTCHNIGQQCCLVCCMCYFGLKSSIDVNSHISGVARRPLWLSIRMHAHVGYLTLSWLLFSLFTLNSFVFFSS